MYLLFHFLISDQGPLYTFFLEVNQTMIIAQLSLLPSCMVFPVMQSDHNRESEGEQ